MIRSGSLSTAWTRNAPGIIGVLGCMLLVGIVAAAAWFSYRQHSDSEHALQMQHAGDMALVLEVHARDTLSSVDDAVRRIKRSYESDGMRTNLRELMADYLDIADYIAVASIADEQGRLILSTLPITEGANIADLEHFRIHVGRDSSESYVNKPVLGRLSGKWSFHMTRRINRADGSFGGVAIVAVDFSYWNRLLQEGGIGESAAIALVGRDGAARAVQARAGAAGDLMKADWGFLLRSIDAGQGRGFALDAEGHSWAYRSLAGYPLFVAVCMDEHELQQRLDAIRSGYILGVLMVAILAILFVIGLLLVLRRQRRNIAERQRMTTALEQSEGRFKAMFDHAGIGIALRPAQDRALPWIAVNDRFCAMTGYSREELLRLSTVDITLANAQDDALRDNARLLNGEISSYVREKQVQCKDGSRLWVTLSVAALPGDDGRPYQIISTYQDINARKLTEERLRAIISAEPECVAIVAPDGRLLDMNPAGLRMLQAENLDEMRRWPFLRQVAPAYRRAFVRLQHRILGGESGILEFEAFGISGRRCWLEIHAAPLYDTSGKITALLGICRDVTERRMARESLATERNLLRTVIDNLPDRIRVKGPDLRYVLSNEAWRKARVADGRDVTNLTDSDLMGPEKAVWFDNEDREVMASGRFSKPREVVDGTKDDPQWFVTTKMPLRDAAGTVIGVVGISRDVTDFKRRSLEVEKLNAALEARVAERTAQLTATNEELEAFASSVSHDLRAPLRHIDGLAAALVEDYSEKLDAPGQDYLNRIRGAAKRMAGLIEDLLRLSRVTRSELNITRTDLSEIARSIVEDLRREQPQRIVDARITPDLCVLADPGMLRAALANLIHNAWKFTGKKSAATIEFGAVQRDGMTVYFVRDDGAGFDMTHAGRLFDAFQRLHTEREFPGTGIGLATVRRVMRRHGGDAWAESTIGLGATFYFTLGARPEVRALLPERQALVLVARQDVPAAPVTARPVVLLVDDDPDVLTLTARAFAPDDYQILMAGRGEEALAILHERSVSVVVSDFSMPGMNGAQLLAQVMALQPDSLRIIVSGQEINSDMRAGMERGAIHHYFDKQHSYDAVKACINDWLRATKP